MTTAWWKESVVYQIYPRSFADGNGDGIGDLPGVIGKLDYLRWLGVDALWLAPFHRSPMADAGYDVSDYCDVDPLFGTLKDFDRLVDAAHARGLKVLIDFAPEQPDSYWSEPRGGAALHDVLDFWLARGVDGFRAGVAHVIGKEQLSRYGHDDELHLVLTLPPIDVPWQAEAFAERIAQALGAFDPIGAWPTWVLNDHDRERIRTRASIGEREARAAAVLTLTLRGTPFLYMGEELGLKDPFAPESAMRNIAAQQTDLRSILWLYRRLLDARRESPALRSGSQTMRQAPSGVLAWSRHALGDAREIWINFEDRAVEVGARGEVMVSSQGLGEGEAFGGTLAPHEAVVLGSLT